jgi:hypothetical protein
MSDSMRARILDHKEKFWFLPPIVESGSYVEIADKALRSRNTSHQVSEVQCRSKPSKMSNTSRWRGSGATPSQLAYIAATATITILDDAVSGKKLH